MRASINICGVNHPSPERRCLGDLLASELFKCHLGRPSCYSSLEIF
uniref:Uncharacterized protein n=1 Tax=Setaria italica TaxID=4555 RepID=K3XTM6_SETIT